MDVALRMLSRRALSEGEIRERLVRKGFSEAQGESVIRRLAELGLVDDARLCAQLVRSYRESRGYGPLKIAWALRARRIPPPLVGEALREFFPAEEEQDAAVAALRKKFREGVPPGREGAARAYRFLTGRGFHPSTCRRAIGGVMFDIKEDEADD